MNAKWNPACDRDLCTPVLNPAARSSSCFMPGMSSSGIASGDCHFYHVDSATQFQASVHGAPCILCREACIGWRMGATWVHTPPGWVCHAAAAKLMDSCPLDSAAKQARLGSATGCGSIRGWLVGYLQPSVGGGSERHIAPLHETHLEGALGPTSRTAWLSGSTSRCMLSLPQAARLPPRSRRRPFSTSGAACAP